MKRRTLLAGIAATAAWPVAIRAQTPPPRLQVIVFPGGGNGWPLWIAQEYGFFERAGINVVITPTPGSIYQMTHLASGDYDIAHTAADNVVAYDSQAGAAPIPAGTSFVAVMGGDNGFLHVMSRPDLTTYDALRGKRIGVDARTTGFAFVLRRVLAANGLKDGDYQLVSAGAGLNRYESLLKGDLDATIQSTPFDVMGAAEGLHVFPPVTTTIGPYQGYVAATTRTWLATNQERMIAYIRAYVGALDWLFDPAHQTEAIAIFASRANVEPAIATRAYAVMTDPHTGYARRAALDLAGMRTVVAMRGSLGLAVALGPAESYIDLGPYHDALARGTIPA